VTVKAGSTFTARVPEKGYPMPVSADDSVVTTVSRSAREGCCLFLTLRPTPSGQMTDAWHSRDTGRHGVHRVGPDGMVRESGRMR
jgi:hypothetical protein